ncbi:M23 family metallopeptidase [Litoribacter alkaliphilus]|uniref:M23 family metallopeptidase n=1 Tax=Litoribacter ruber TaxID=702568 RepID=A0AAP2G4E5_9BACT|nr:M23 family metallopeptidase [Litoribacter alkaliphilus]MBS9523971.1 M23 family metallopeptidase [Litoribacter alkaliphilus]
MNQNGIFLFFITMKKYVSLIAITLLMACNGTRVDRFLGERSPYEKYKNGLETSSLEHSAMVRDWVRIGEKVLSDSLSINLPYQEVGYFDPKEASAMLLRYEVKEGQRINVKVEPVSQVDSQYFVDVFEVGADGQLARRHYAEEELSISYEVKKDGLHAVRVQPELFRGGVFSLQVSNEATLAFPIPEKTSRNIASFYGDGRDAGARKHEGVDIFAPRGTPVVAVRDGRVRRVGNNRLGGKVVNLSGPGYSYYYAHLDSQLVDVGQAVQLGDTLGLVGNTGNAITTAPHLHFGIYRAGRGAVDPFHFLHSPDELAEMELQDTTMIGNFHRVANARINLRSLPSTSGDIVRELSQHEVLRVEAQTKDWYRVTLPNQEKAYVFASLVEPVENPLETVTLSQSDLLREDKEGAAYFENTLESGEAERLGHFENEQLLRTASGRLLWKAPVED